MYSHATPQCCGNQSTERERERKKAEAKERQATCVVVLPCKVLGIIWVEWERDEVNDEMKQRSIGVPDVKPSCELIETSQPMRRSKCTTTNHSYTPTNQPRKTTRSNIRSPLTKPLTHPPSTFSLLSTQIITLRTKHHRQIMKPIKSIHVQFSSIQFNQMGKIRDKG